MQWYKTLAKWLKSKGRHRMISRERDGEQQNYLERFYILSTNYVGIYLHRFWADDDDGLHDHPWNSISVLLSGSYLEEMPTVTKLRRPGNPLFYIRSKKARHRITVPKDSKGTWSLFIRFGLKRKKWGFYRDDGWQAAEIQSRREYEFNNRSTVKSDTE